MCSFYERSSSYDSYPWDTEFSSFRHQFHAPSENKTSNENLDSFVTGSGSVLHSYHGNKPTRSESTERLETISRFMKSPAGCMLESACTHQRKLVVDFCRYREIEERDTRHVALVYEWENKPHRLPQQREPYQKPLTHNDLHTRLCRRRYLERPSTPTARGSHPDGSHAPELDGDRRIIYINNLDAPTISILADTTSPLETPAIQRTILKHLTAQTSLDVSITGGFKTFSLELNISYFCLRQEPNLIQCDKRQRGDGAGPLRKSLLCPLRPSDDISVGKHPFHIYETQLSIAVSGVDHWRWTAWGFFDTWFDPADHVSVYHEGEASGCQPDPLSNGQLDVEPPECRPRKYFLRLLEIHIGRIANEWKYILSVLEQEVREISSDPLLSFPERSFQSKEGREIVRRLATWNDGMIRLVGTLLKTLSQSLVAWDAFQRIDISYFRDSNAHGSDQSSLSSSSASSIMGEENHCHSKPERLSPSLRVIEKGFLSIHNTHDEMKQLRTTLEDLRKALVRGEEGYSTYLQQRTGEHVKLLTWVTLGWSPVIIATGMCSAQEGIFPFRNNIWDFFACLLVIGTLVGGTIIVLLRWQNSNLIEWKIMSVPSSEPLATHKDDKEAGASGSFGPQKSAQVRRGRRGTSFASSSRTLIGNYGRWTTSSGMSSTGGKSILEKGLELSGLKNTVFRGDVGEHANDARMRPLRAYFRSGQGPGPEEPHMIV